MAKSLYCFECDWVICVGLFKTSAEVGASDVVIYSRTKAVHILLRFDILRLSII